ncbi:hypothetical protein U1Q18_030192 [Sarracenia purpurea var. burkii]
MVDVAPTCARVYKDRRITEEGCEGGSNYESVATESQYENPCSLVAAIVKGQGPSRGSHRRSPPIFPSTTIDFVVDDLCVEYAFYHSKVMIRALRRSPHLPQPQKAKKAPSSSESSTNDA